MLYIPLHRLHFYLSNSTLCLRLKGVYKKSHPLWNVSNIELPQLPLQSFRETFYIGCMWNIIKIFLIHWFYMLLQPTPLSKFPPPMISPTFLSPASQGTHSKWTHFSANKAPPLDPLSHHTVYVLDGWNLSWLLIATFSDGSNSSLCIAAYALVWRYVLQ